MREVAAQLSEFTAMPHDPSKQEEGFEFQIDP
jgi:hypothetical protein